MPRPAVPAWRRPGKPGWLGGNNFKAMKNSGDAVAVGRRHRVRQFKGPTLYDYVVKPDIVAPGNLIHSTLTQNLTASGLYMMYPTTVFVYLLPELLWDRDVAE
jgi:hypothetical protein